MYDKTKYIYVGLDLHKEQHTAVIMDCFNDKLGEITFQNKPSEFGSIILLPDCCKVRPWKNWQRN